MEEIDWEKESKKRAEWNVESSYSYSHQNLIPRCGYCVHSSNVGVCGSCDLITSKCNIVQVFSGCRRYFEPIMDGRNKFLKYHIENLKK